MKRSRLLLLAATSGLFIVACGPGSSARSDSAYGSLARSVDSAASTSAAAPTSTAGAPSPIPPSIDSVGTHGEDLYDEIKAGNWTKAKSLVAALQTDLKQVPPTNSGATAQLNGLIDSLGRAIATKQKHQALVEANEVTRVAAEMTRPFTSATPVDVLLLDYYGRELEIWSSAKDTARLRQTTSDIRRAWDAVKPAVLKRKGDAAAKQMDAIMVKLEAAKTPVQWGAAAKPLLDEVDELEKVFTTQ